MGRLKFGASRTVSRVLSFKAIICLGRGLLHCSRHPSKLWPSKPLLSVLLRIGFTGRIRLRCAGELLPRLSPLPRRKTPCGISLLHFPLRSPSAAVSRYPALRSPDFPHTACVRDRPSHSQYYIILKRNKSQGKIPENCGKRFSSQRRRRGALRASGPWRTGRCS